VAAGRQWPRAASGRGPPVAAGRQWPRAASSHGRALQLAKFKTTLQLKKKSTDITDKAGA
jgi:hypothetical protein